MNITSTTSSTSSTISLSKIKILNGIDINTPSCAIVDIASDYGLLVNEQRLTECKYRTHVISQINKREPREVDISNNQMLRHVAHFLNPDKLIQWTRPTLISKLDMSLNIINGEFHQYPVGYSTPQQFRITPALASGMLKKKGIILTSHITTSDLDNLINYISLSQSQQLEKLLSIIYSSNPIDMSLMLCNANNIQTWDNWDTFKVSQYIIDGIDKMSYYPTDPACATAIVAIKFRLDISSATNPLIEFKALMDNKFPIDNRIRKILAINSRSFQLDMFINPIFPIELYNDTELNSLKKKNNITVINRNDVYNTLIVKYGINSFYRSVPPTLTKLETPINLYSLDELTPHTPLVCYGSNGNMLLYRIKELTEVFNNYNLFTLGGDYNITMSAVNDLKHIHKSIIDNRNLTSNVKNEWIKLSNSIKSIEKTFTDTDIIFDNFSEYCNKDRYPIIKDILWIMFELSMYMRGWDGINKWPINNKDIPKFTDAQYNTQKAKADRLTFNCMKKFKSKCNNPTGEYIMKLPLIRYYNGKWQMSQEFHFGNNIEERIKIIDDDLIVSGCIGLSSNWLMATSYFYLDAINSKPNFNIKNMSTVTESVSRVVGGR